MRHALAPTIYPLDASIKEPLNWSVIGENHYGITFEGNTMITPSEIDDTVLIKAIIPNGMGYNKQFYKQFNIVLTK